MSNTDYSFRTGDQPEISIELPGNLTKQGASVVFNMRSVVDRGATAISREDATVGEYDDDDDVTTVTYSFSQGELSDAGEYLAEFEASYADGTIESFPQGRYYFVRVTEEIA